MAQTIETKYDLDLDEFFQKMNLVSNRLGTVEDALTGMRRQNPFIQANQSAAQFNTTLGQQVAVYQKIDATVEAFRQEQVRLKQVYVDLKARQAEFIAAGKYGELTANLDQVKTRLAELKKGFPELADQVEKLNKPGKGGSSGGGVKGLVAELGTAITVSFGVAEAMRLMVTESARFGKSLSQLSALTGVTGKDLDFLADAAVNLEAKTGIAAADIVEGFKLVGGIKPELLESKEALAQVTDEVVALAQASGETLADSATVAIGALNQFQEGADQAGRFVNVLAAGAKVGASEVRDTGEALKASGTAMKAAGLSFEQGNAVIQSLAGVMIKGSEAGTGLRNVLLKLETDTDKNLRPSIVGLDKALENASQKYNTTTELTKVFGVENIVAARRILDTRNEISQLTKELTGTNVAYEQQRVNLDNLSTDLDKAGTAFKGFFRDLGQSQDGFLRFAIQSFTNFFTQLSSKSGEYKAFFRGFFEEGLFQSLPGALVRGRRELEKQQQINGAANALRVQNQTVKQTAAQQVGGAIDTRTGQLIDSGVSKDNAAVQAAQEAYDRAQANLTKIRKQYNDTAAQLRTAVGKEKTQLVQDGKLDALALKQARENATVASAALAQAQKDRAGRAAALKSALSEPASDADKKAGREAQKAAEDNYRLLLSAQQDYVREYQKLEEQFGKDKLDALKKDQNAYIAEKARLDKAAVDAEEQHLLKLLQLASSNRTQINKLTGQREVVANTSVSLPADVKAQFDAKRKEIDIEADRQIRINRIRQEYDLLELGKQSNAQELALYDKKWEERLVIEEKGAEKYAEMIRQRDSARLDYVKRGNLDELNEFDAKWEAMLASEEKNAAKYAALVKKRDADRRALAFDQIIRDQKAIETIANYNVDLRKKPDNVTGTQFAKTNELDRIANSLYSAESQIEALNGQNNPGNTPEIKRLEAYVKALKDKRKEIALLQPANRDIWDLLGISKSFTDDTERQVFLQGVDLISSAIHSATQAAIEDSEARIQALDAQITAKQEQVSIEEERDKEGYANNLALRRAELDDLKRQKAEEEAVKRRALAVQQALDLAATVSNNAVTVSNTVAAISEMFKQYGKIPFVGVVLALGAVATILSTIVSVKAKARAITQLRKGGKLNGPSHEQGGIRGTGAFGDIEVEGKEYVTNSRSSEQYDQTLEAINQNDPKRAFMALMREGGFGMPALVVQHMQNPGWGSSKPADLSAMQNLLAEHGDLLKQLVKHTKPGKAIYPLADGSWLEVENGKTTHRKP